MSNGTSGQFFAWSSSNVAQSVRQRSLTSKDTWPMALAEYTDVDRRP
ncbi:hypothetical protein ACWGH3_38130 [Streptomyces sp. NPDC054884]|nr:hypothetical protein [Streptomyces sp. ME08-AFT2]MDX3312078.1 hypothetical protein [Streptomyces sp. ME08-AFT2]